MFGCLDRRSELDTLFGAARMHWLLARNGYASAVHHIAALLDTPLVRLEYPFSLGGRIKFESLLHEILGLVSRVLVQFLFKSFLDGFLLLLQ